MLQHYEAQGAGGLVYNFRFLALLDWFVILLSYHVAYCYSCSANRAERVDSTSFLRFLFDTKEFPYPVSAFK